MRRLLLTTFAVGAALVVAMIAFLWPKSDPQRVPAGTTEAITEAGVTYLDRGQLFVVALDGEFLALDSDARHVGDRALYCGLTETFVSPAHGETFDLAGRYVGGPATGDMGRYRVIVDSGVVYVDLASGPSAPDRSEDAFDSAVGGRCLGDEDPPGFFSDGTR